MTLQASRLNATVEEMLLEAGQESDRALRAALLSLGRLGSLPAPPPNAQLAALLGSRPDDLSWRRRLRRHRPAIVGLVVVAGMGLGATGVAATASRPTQQESASLQQLLEDWAPSWSVSGLRAAAPATVIVPGPAIGAQQAAAESRTPDGQQESLVRGPAGQPAGPPAGPAGAAGHDAGPGTGDEPGSAGGAKTAAVTERADREPGDKEPTVPAEAGTLPDNAKESAREARAETGKLLSGAVPERLSGTVPERAVPERAEPENAGPKEAGRGSSKPGAGKKADSGAKWLEKFSR